MAFCIECKCCEAQPDFEKCVFCEDGVPCPNRERLFRAVAPATPVRVAAPARNALLTAPVVAAVAKDVQKEKEIEEMNKTSEVRICPVEGCANKLNANNKSGFCAGHWYESQKSKPAGARKSKPASPPRKIVAKPEPLAGIATICVTETNLDAFWMRLSLEEKANLFQRQLEGA
jgi:hypothetical protein